MLVDRSHLKAIMVFVLCEKETSYYDLQLFLYTIVGLLVLILQVRLSTVLEVFQVPQIQPISCAGTLI